MEERIALACSVHLASQQPDAVRGLAAGARVEGLEVVLGSSFLHGRDGPDGPKLYRGAGVAGRSHSGCLIDEMNPPSSHVRPYPPAYRSFFLSYRHCLNAIVFAPSSLRMVSLANVDVNTSSISSTVTRAGLSIASESKTQGIVSLRV